MAPVQSNRTNSNTNTPNREERRKRLRSDLFSSGRSPFPTKSPSVTPKRQTYFDRYIPSRRDSPLMDGISVHLAIDDEEKSQFSQCMQNDLDNEEVASPVTPKPLFRFQSPRKTPSKKKTLMPRRQTSTPQSSIRYDQKISKTAYKILDAPGLQDDFYLNLLDWSHEHNVISVALGTSVYLWNAPTASTTSLVDLQQEHDCVTSLKFSNANHSNSLAIGTQNGAVLLYDIETRARIWARNLHTNRIGTMDWNGDVLATASKDSTIVLSDIRTRSCEQRVLRGHEQEVCGIQWNSDGKTIASGGNDNHIRVWDTTSTAQPMCDFTSHIAAVKALSWSPTQRGVLASGGGTADRTIRLWNTLQNKEMSCTDTGSQVCNIAWSQDARYVVSTHGYSLNHVNVWDSKSMTKLVTLNGHSTRVLYLAVSPNGEDIVTGAGDETLRFWKVFPGSKPKISTTSFLRTPVQLR